MDNTYNSYELVITILENVMWTDDEKKVLDGVQKYLDSRKQDIEAVA
jgi:hypothetical protein